MAILPTLDERVRAWLSSGVDLSMVASAYGLDPLAHREDPEVRLLNKTGTSDGVRADIGLVGTTPYAAIANWDPAGPEVGDGVRAEVLATMRGLGGLLARDRIHDPFGPCRRARSARPRTSLAGPPTGRDSPT